MTEKLDIDHLRQWIGRSEDATDIVTAQLVKGLRATLFQEVGEPKTGDAAPFTVHWCLAQPVFPMSMLGPDGHPTRGGFLPPVPLPRRMWAGGELEFVDTLRVGDEVTRTSRIADAQAIEKFQFAAGPHPARQRHRRQETAAGGMAVGAEFRHRVDRLRQAPMHGKRRRIAGSRLADLLEQGSTQALHQLRGDDVGCFRGPADPLTQMIEVEFFGKLFGHDLARARGAFGSSVCSPMAGTAP